MRYASAASFRRALEDRLQQRARDTGEPLMRLRKSVAFQRLLARLQQVAPDRWMLKGGLALDFRLADRAGPQPRATKDMDLARTEGLETADVDFRAVVGVELHDFFEFGIERMEVPQEEDKVAGGAALRYRVTASLASRTFERVLVDVGVAPPPVEPEVVQAPDLLGFAGVPPVRVLAIPAAWHVAEKVHAYTRRYGRDEAPSSRPKDLIDLVLLATHEDFRAADLLRALRGTFASRDTRFPRRCHRRPRIGQERTRSSPIRSAWITVSRRGIGARERFSTPRLMGRCSMPPSGMLAPKHGRSRATWRSTRSGR